MHLLSRRNHGIVEAIRRVVSLPLLSAPSETSGAVLARDLVDRLSAWDRAGEPPIAPDLAFAVDNMPEALGGLLESYVLNELLRALPMQHNDYRLFHWRSPDKKEIDILIDGGSDLVGVEVKASAAVRQDDFKHLSWFASDDPEHSRTCTGVVFYLGQEKLSFGNRTFALPVSTLWGEIAV